MLGALDPSLDIIAVRESLKFWLISRFAKTAYARNRDVIVGEDENIFCINDTGKVCAINSPRGIYRAIQSPGVNKVKNKGYCNATDCPGWCPPMILDRAQVAAVNTIPPRFIMIDWLENDPRLTGIMNIQFTVASTNVSDDVAGYKLMSLRNALVQVLDAPDAPDAKNIPIYRRSNRGHIVPLESHKTTYKMGLAPLGNERMMRHTSPESTRSDRSSFNQESDIMASHIFTLRCVACKMVNPQGAFR